MVFELTDDRGWHLRFRDAMVWEHQINEAYWQGHKGSRGLKLLKDLEKLSLAYTEEGKVSENN